jgi:signal peptidase I
MSIIGFLKPTPKRIIFTVVIFALVITLPYVYSGLFPYFFNIESNSMSPAINRYDLLFAKKVSFDNLKIGDIVMYSVQRGQPMIVHRIVNIDHDTGLFSTKGDNNSGQMAIEKNVSSDKIYAQVAGAIPLIGIIGGFGLFILLVLAVYLLSCVIFRGPRPNSAASQGKL